MEDNKKEPKNQEILNGTTPPQKTDTNKAIPEWLAPILSSLGSMGGSYMLWIKPLQDKMEVTAKQMNDLQKEVKELREEVKSLNKEKENYGRDLQKITARLEQNLNSIDYLPTKKSIGQGSYLKRRV